VSQFSITPIYFYVINKQLIYVLILINPTLSNGVNNISSTNTEITTSSGRLPTMDLSLGYFHLLGLLKNFITNLEFTSDSAGVMVEYARAKVQVFYCIFIL